MSYCSGSPDPASPMAANFTEFGAKGSATSWAVTLHHVEMTRSNVVRRVTYLRSIRETRGPEVDTNVLRLQPSFHYGALVPRKRGAIRLTRKRTMNTKKQILATSAAAKATTPKPSMPAMIAITKNTNE